MAVCGVFQRPAPSLAKSGGDAVIPTEPLAQAMLFPAGSNCSILATTNLLEVPGQGRWRSRS